MGWQAPLRGQIPILKSNWCFVFQKPQFGDYRDHNSRSARRRSEHPRRRHLHANGVPLSSIMVAVSATARTACSTNRSGLSHTRGTTRTGILAFRRPFSRHSQVALSGRIAQGRDSAGAGEPPTLILGKAALGIELSPYGQTLGVVADHCVITGRSATGTTKDKQERDTQTGGRGNVDFQFHIFAFHSLLADLRKAVIVIAGYHPPAGAVARLSCSFPINHNPTNSKYYLWK